MLNRILDLLGMILFFAMVPFMPITLWLMYLGMYKLGLVGI
jgi:hypothetical protein